MKSLVFAFTVTAAAIALYAVGQVSAPSAEVALAQATIKVLQAHNATLRANILIVQGDAVSPANTAAIQSDRQQIEANTRQIEVLLSQQSRSMHQAIVAANQPPTASLPKVEEVNPVTRNAKTLYNFSVFSYADRGAANKHPNHATLDKDGSGMTIRLKWPKISPAGSILRVTVEVPNQ